MQQIDPPADAGTMGQRKRPSPRSRLLGGVLALSYVALFALATYLESIRIEDSWPVWLLIVGGVSWFSVMLVLPFLVVKYLLGMDLSPLWRFATRFSLRGMLIGVFFVSVLIWYFTQMQWSVQRSFWLTAHAASARCTEGPAPFGLRLVGEKGQSRIEITGATKEQIAEAKRLFPEATVVATGQQAAGPRAAPAAPRRQQQPAPGE